MSNNRGEEQRQEGVDKFQNTLRETKISDFIITQFIEHSEEANG